MAVVKCSATTRAGRPCNAPAVRGTEPPLCSAHSGRTAKGSGGQKGNQNRRTHGFYGRYYTKEEVEALNEYRSDGTLEDEIALMRVAMRRVIAHMNKIDDDIMMIMMTKLLMTGGRTLAKMLRDKQVLDGGDGSVLRELAEALDELGTEWGIEI